jgi:glycosyltransferase involved in cell wall biosynthesis
MNNPKPLVAIIMATYNGADFIREQIDSILKQNNVDVHFYISDDNSTDGTLNTINDFRQKYPENFKGLFNVQFKSPCKNFLNLVNKIDDSYDYYAFSDQDDIWFPDKLKHAINIINQEHDLYCGRTEIVNSKLTSLGYSPLFSFPPSFQNAIVQSIAGGNTMVFNKKIFTLLKNNSQVEVQSHDWWTYILATFTGHNVYYDQNPKVLYRQHNYNYNGSNIGFFNQIARIFYGLVGRYKSWTDKHFVELSRIVDLGTKQSLKTFYQYGILRNRRYLFKFSLNDINRVGIYRQTAYGNLSLKLAIFLKRA